MATFSALPPAGGDVGALAPETSRTAVQPQTTYDPKQVVGEVDAKYSRWRDLKRANEIQWFVNNAMVRGVNNVRWNDTISELELRRQPTYKNVPNVNKILPKVRQRKSKFLKNRYIPMIAPASSDKEDKLNAEATQRGLEYVGKQQKLEHKYRQTLDWTVTCGKGFIWLFWDNNARGLIKNPLQNGAVEATIGDVVYEVGNPFEVLVPDLGLPTLAEQHEIMRVKVLPLDELKRRYSDSPEAQAMKGDSNGEDIFVYQRQIASLSTKAAGNILGGTNDHYDRDLNYVVRKELFQRPSAKYPKGRYAVVAGGQLLRYQEELPYQFERFSNPYPVVEFADIEVAGQFWPTSTTEQLIGPQREYTDYRSKLKNHLANQTHPKLIISALAKLPTNAWSDEAGEVIKVLLPPGVPPPQVVTPPNISADLWRAMDLIRQEMDEIASLPPVISGSAGGTTSGFQVNLLQEATDSVHAPDIRGHEMAFEELYAKTRKLMAKGYTIPRLISVIGRAHIPDVVEFSNDNIDENAEITVHTGTALSNSPAVRTQQVLELWQAGILQDPNNPAEGQRRALTMLDTEGIGEFQEEKRRDQQKARLENLNIGRGQFVDPPLPFDDHMIHYESHTDQMKSPEFDLWDDAKQRELFVHTLIHAKFINPEMAMQTAAELGLYDIIPFLQPAPIQPMQPMQGGPAEMAGPPPPPDDGGAAAPPPAMATPPPPPPM